MRSNVFAFSVHLPVSTFADLESPEIMLFADWTLAGSTRDLPPEAPIAVLTQSSWACLLLEVECLLLQIIQQVDIFSKHIFIKPVVLQLAYVVDRSELITKVGIFELLSPRKRRCSDLIRASAA